MREFAQETRSTSNTTDVDIIKSSQSSVESTSKSTTDNQSETKTIKPTNFTVPYQHQSTNSIEPNPCVICLEEERRLACIPCGHLATCVPCGHSLRSCPICRKEIEAFIRIYI